MPADLVLGTQWGDEGKGKITDVLGARADLIVRFQGGNNAGHTIKAKGVTYKLHHLPSGVVRGTRAVIGNGCVVDPQVLLEEIERLAAHGIQPDLVVSDRAHVITPMHRALDGAEEAVKGKASVGTTKRGIGPTYADKMSRVGLRVGDLVRPERLRAKVKNLVQLRNRTLDALGSDDRFNGADVYETLKAQGERLAPYIMDATAVVQDAFDAGKNVLLEGAQGTMLDIDFGTWPFVTSSNTTAGAAISGTGLPPSAIGRVFGVMKAYTTRVGAGPFATELDSKGGPGKHLLDVGREFGTTTGRPRRCGWLDLVVVDHAKRLSGVTQIALTKLDVLNGLKELKIATHYDIAGTQTARMPSDPDDLAAAKPVYESFQGWDALPAAEAMRTLDDLPAPVREYLGFIEERLGIGYALVSTGPAREETLLLL